MTFTAVDASGGGDGHFPQHPKTGDWETLKGRMLTPPLQMPLESTNHMNPRPQAQSSIDGLWNEHIVVTTGETGGGGAMAK
jgi:hypothetical protein